VSKQQAQVTAGFDSANSASNIGLSIENDPGLFNVDAIHLLQFPDVGASLFTDVGKVEAGSSKAVPVNGGVLQFSGGTEASLGKVPNSPPTFKTLFAIPVTALPKGGSVSFTYDGTHGVLRANVPCYAAVAYGKYETQARQLRYYPATEALPSGGVSTTFGFVVAYMPPNSVSVFQVEPFNVDDGNSEFELYRIVSDAVTTRDGEFEKPPSFPSSGTYPAKTTVVDTATFVQTERVHEIGLMDNKGRAWVRTFFVPNLEPYIGDVAYKPTKTLKSATPPSNFSPDLVLAAKQAVAKRGQGTL
jgi:hypothetical protein